MFNQRRIPRFQHPTHSIGIELDEDVSPNYTTMKKHLVPSVLFTGMLILILGCKLGIQETVEEVEIDLPTPERFSSTFFINENNFELVDAEGIKSQFNIEGSFGLLFEKCDEQYCVSINSFTEVIRGVSLSQLDINIDSLPLTMENLDLEKSTGTYNPETGALALEININSLSSPALDSLVPSITFQEEGHFDLIEGNWNISGQSNFKAGDQIFAASTSSKNGEAHPEADQIIYGLAQIFREMRSDANIADDAKKCHCKPSCKLAAKQIIGAMNVEDMAMGVANAVFTGTLEAINPTTRFGKLAKRVLEGMIDEFVDGDIAMEDTGIEVHLGDIAGQNVDKDCTVDFAITYNKATRKVKALFICDCEGKKCMLKVEYKAEASGLAKGRYRMNSWH